MSTPASAKDEATSFTIHLSIFILIALLLVLSITLPRYQHDLPAGECSPYDYPICERATAPQPLPPADLRIVFLAIVGTAALALLLAYISYHACVIEQAQIITPTADIGKPATAPPGVPAATPAPAAATHAIANATTHALTTPMPPAAKPKAGVDMKNIG